MLCYGDFHNVMYFQQSEEFLKVNILDVFTGGFAAWIIVSEIQLQYTQCIGAVVLVSSFHTEYLAKLETPTPDFCNRFWKIYQPFSVRNYTHACKHTHTHTKERTIIHYSVLAVEYKLYTFLQQQFLICLGITDSTFQRNFSLYFSLRSCYLLHITYFSALWYLQQCISSKPYLKIIDVW